MAVAETGALPTPAPIQPTPDRQPSRLLGYAIRAYWLWPALITLAVSCWKLGTPSLWADELATWGAVRVTWSQLFRLVSHVDAVIAPYYVLAKAWAAVAGTSAVALRLPSVIATVAAAGLVTVLGARLWGRRTGLLAGLLFALTPATTRYAQEARPYAFAILFAVLATLMLVRFLDRPTRGTGAWYAVAVALLAAFHIIGLLLLLGHAVAARHRLRAWAIWAGCGTLPALPLLALGYGQRSQVSWIPPAHLHAILGAPDIVFVSADVGGALVVLAALALAWRPDVVLLASWALVPVLALAALGQVAPLFYARYLLIVMPAWVLLAAFTLDRLPRYHALAIVLVIAMLGEPTQVSIRTESGHAGATSAAGAIIARNERPGDGIAYRLNETAPWEARDMVTRYVPAAHRPIDVFQVVPQRINGYLAATECPELTACLDKVDPARMWIVRQNGTPDPLLGIGPAKESLLRSRYRLAQLWQVRGLTVALYTHI